MSRIQRRIRQPGVYFITSHTWQRRQLFRDAGPAEIVVSQIIECRDRGFYALHAFVLMPDHIHVLLTPGEEMTLEKAVQMIKGGSAYRVRKNLSYRWPIWQSGFHDRWIRDVQEYTSCLQYIRQNPVKAGLAVLAEEYHWSSASGHYALDKSCFDFQGLKPREQQLANVAAKAATHKPQARH